MTPAREREWAERIIRACDTWAWALRPKLTMRLLQPLLAAFAKEVRDEERATLHSAEQAMEEARVLLHNTLLQIRAREKGGEG